MREEQMSEVIEQIVPIPLPRNTSKKARGVLLFLIFSIIGVTFFLPILWMISTAFKTSAETASGKINLIPKAFTFANFSAALDTAPFLGYVGNSLIVVFFAVILTVFINCLAGYAFAKYKFRGKNALFMMVLSTLMIPIQIIMIPNFFVLKDLGWLNSYAGLIIPRAAEAFGLFLARQYMKSIPDELIEAGRIDGASEWKIFIKLILPNIKPLIAVLTIFTFMWRWNDLIWPLVVVSDESMYTVQLGLAMIQRNDYFVNWNQLMSLTLLSITPVVLVFLFFQKYFVQGTVGSGMKE